MLVALLWYAGAGRVSGSTRSRQESVEVILRTVLDNLQRRCHVGVNDIAAVADVLAVESPDVQMQGVEVATVPPVEGTHVLVLPLARRLKVLGTQQVLAGSGRLQDHPRIR